MKKSVRWIAWGIGILFLTLLIAIWVIPRLVDVAKYKPEIEKYVSEMTGRPFFIDGELALSLFPQIKFSFSGLRLGSPPGFSQANLLSIDNFDARLKLVPLISGRVEIDRFRLDGLRLALEKNGERRGNWEGPAKAGPQAPGAKDKKSTGSQSGGGLPVMSLVVEELLVGDGSVLWVDAGRKERHELSGIHLVLKDLSYEKPVGIDFSGQLDGVPVAVKGKVGPLGKTPGKGVLPLELAVSFLDQAHLSLAGTLRDAAQHPAFDFKLVLAPFSPRKLALAAGGDPVFKTADPGVLEHLALQANVAGSPTQVTVTEGRIELDDSRIALEASARDFAQPNVALDLNIDRIDLDRYMPAAQGSPPGEATAPLSAPATKAAPRPTPEAVLKSLVIDASLSVGRLTAHRVVVENLLAKLTGANGVFHLTPVSADINKGTLEANAIFDLSQSLAASRLDLKAAGIQAGPLALALFDKDVIGGELQARAALTMSGQRLEDIKKTLNGTAEFVFENGVIKGIDLAALVGAAEKALDFSLYQGNDSRTGFSEIRAPFRIANGKGQTDESTLSSPLIKVTAAGTADLATEALDFRIQPQFAYAAGKSGGTKPTDIRLPLLLGGTFSEPELRPDVNSLARDQLEKRILESNEFKKVFKNEELKPFEEAAKGLLKGILPR